MTAVLNPITGISSMATRALLAELARSYQVRSGHLVTIESVGGVDAATRVRDGEPFDAVVLARDAIDKLLVERHLVPGTEVDLARSAVAVAVRAGTRRPAVDSESALSRAVLDARAIGISTGPSGVQIKRLFDRWRAAPELRNRIVTAPPGVPVGMLVARGDVEIGFQQLSELIGVEGIEVLGTLPSPVQIVTTFAAAVGTRAAQPKAAHAMLQFFASHACADEKRRQGMEAP